MNISKITRERLFKNRVLFSGLGIAIFFLWYGYSRVYLPQLRTINKIKGAILEESANIGISKKVANARNGLDSFKGYFASNADASWLMDRVSSIAKEAGLNVLVLNSRPLVQTKYFVYSNVRLSANGTYHQLGDFVAGIENSKEFMTIEKLTFKKNNASLNADIVVASYFWVRPGQTAAADVKQHSGVRYTGRDTRDPLDNSVLAKMEIGERSKEEAERRKSFPKEDFLVSAIIWGSKVPQAIINEKVVGIGENLDGGRIIRIDREGVHVDFEGGEVLLTIK